MTGYAAMSSEGRASAREATAGRRKRLIVEHREIAVARLGGTWVEQPPFPRHWVPTPGTEPAWEAVGECGHVLAWNRTRPFRLPAIGTRKTCEHDDCRIPAKPVVPDAERCEAIEGSDVGRRCPTRWRHDTAMGKVCERHRRHYVRAGYL